jgi:hypothetical protein
VKSGDPARRPWDENYELAIQMARLQGRIYDELYSATALVAEAEQRARIIGEIEGEMLKWRDEQYQVGLSWISSSEHAYKSAQIDASSVAYPDIWALSRHHWDIVYHSTLTMLLRASADARDGAKITAKCFDAAELSLKSHMACFNAWEGSGITSGGKNYANWYVRNV